MSLSTFSVRSDDDITYEGHEYNVGYEIEITWAAGMEGQDADGNRGMWMEWEDERTWTILHVRRYNDELDLEDPIDLATLDPDFKTAIDAVLETLEVERPDPECYEPQYDREDD